MAAEDSKITKPDLKEIVASVVAVIAALALTLSNDWLRGDQAMALADRDRRPHRHRHHAPHRL